VYEEVGALQSWYNAGVDFSLADYNGRTALHVAVAHCHGDHVAFLLAHGADPRAIDVNGLTPLDVARQKCLTDIEAQLNAVCCSTSELENGCGSDK